MRRASLASDGTGLSVPDIARIGILRVVTEFEALGRVEIVAAAGIDEKGGAA